jgi:hypothetical protein
VRANWAARLEKAVGRIRGMVRSDVCSWTLLNRYSC